MPLSRPAPRHVPLPRQLLQGAPGRDGVGVVGAEDALADGQGAFEEVGSNLLVTLDVKRPRQMFDSNNSARLVGPERPLTDGHSPLVDWHRGTQVSVLIKQRCQAREAWSGHAMVGSYD